MLAHAYYPGTYKKAGDTHMDDDENWAVKTLPHGKDYMTIEGGNFD